MITDSWAQQSASVGLWVAGATLSALRWVMISLSVSPRPSDPPPTQIPETLPDVADSTYAPTGSSRLSHTGPSSHEPPARSDSGMGSKGACQRAFCGIDHLCVREKLFSFLLFIRPFSYSHSCYIEFHPISVGFGGVLCLNLSPNML